MANNETTISKIENGRAEYAYSCVKQVGQDKKYKSYVKKLPAYIQTNGLAATLAFIDGKKEKAYKKLYEHIGDWLKQDQKKLISLEEGKELVRAIVEVDSHTYRAVTNEVLALVNWLRRFADGLIEGEE